MSLLMKALKKAERGPRAAGGAGWSLEPLDAPRQAEAGATPRPAQAAADLIRAREASREGTRLAILLGALVAVVVGMGAYFYVAVHMPWLLLPKPAAVPAATPAATAPVAEVSPAPPARQAEVLPPLSAPPRGEAAAPVPTPQAAPDAGPPLAPATPREERPTARRTDAGVLRAVPAAAPAAQTEGLAAAYALLQSGQYEAARQAYEKLHAAQPLNTDVLLGLAVIAQNQDRQEQAAQLYLRALELDPRNAYAKAALVDLIGRADPAAAESRLKQLAQQQPAGYLHFALGNLYAGQGRWSEAQAAYFEAQRLDPDAADYAFNLAVSLEHIGQPRAAAEYYQRALRLAGNGGFSHFDPAQARTRLQQLSR